MVKILNEVGVRYESFDILSDNSVREGLKVRSTFSIGSHSLFEFKKFSNWPTYPQLYVSGKLIGGLDIVKELHEEGELLGAIPAESKMQK